MKNFRGAISNDDQYISEQKETSPLCVKNSMKSFVGEIFQFGCKIRLNLVFHRKRTTLPITHVRHYIIILKLKDLLITPNL